MASSAAANEFVNFLNKSPSPYHAVDELKKKLVAVGFQELKEFDTWNVKPLDKLKEFDTWNVKPLDKYFVTKNQSTLVAFAVGGNYVPGEGGFSIIGAHTDSPVLKLKPITKVLKHGFLQVAVQLYGGGLWHTWLDRDLKLAGRVLLKSGNGVESRLVHVNKPIMRIPNLAIHLDREQNSSFSCDKEKHLAPIIATVVKEKLEGTPPKSTEQTNYPTTEGKHHSCLLNLLSSQLNCQPPDIIDFDLNLLDHCPSTIGGLYDEFIFSGRIDNLHSTFTGVTGFINSLSDPSSLSNDPNVRVYSSFDNEEVGSESAQGASSAFQIHVLKRLSVSETNPSAFEQNIGRSLLISADCAHALHPNFSEKHEERHRPSMHGGVTLKFNANQRYATTDISAGFMRQLATIANVPLQDFVVINASPCGSTIGPLMATKLGIMTVDLGCPQLSMHSIREMCDTSGVYQASTLFKAFYENYPRLFAASKIN